MTLLAPLAVVVLLSTPPGLEDRRAVLREIGEAIAAGEVSEATGQALRLAALRAPDQLPPALRRRLADLPPAGPACFTSVATAAFQHLRRHGDPTGELGLLLAPPGDQVFTLDSTSLPIRVSWAHEHEEGLARAVLAAAETSWVVESGYGFFAPTIERGALLYRLYVKDTGMGGGGYTAPYAEDGNTEWNDCFTYIVIDPGNGLGDVPGIVAHEVAHATQAAMDCQELIAFWENSATYIMSQVFPEAWSYTTGMMPYFQAIPWKPLHHFNHLGSDLSEYGGGLWVLWLAEQFAAPGEGPQLLAEIWRATMETGEDNEPDCYDAIAAVLAGRGVTDPIEKVVADFQEARFFIGARDDGAHLSFAGELAGAEVALAARHFGAELPLLDQHLPVSRWPESYGVAHVLLELPERFGMDVVIGFDGADHVRWDVRALRLLPGGPAEVHPLALDELTRTGSVTLSPAGAEGLLLLAVNLGREGFDPDLSLQNTRASFAYAFEVLVPEATVDRLEPAEVRVGRQGVDLRLVGSGFVDGSRFGIDLGDPAVRVTAIRSVSATEVRFEVGVSPEAAPGPRTLTLTNRDGRTVAGPGMLTVVTGDADAGPTGPRLEGGGCATASGPGGEILLGLMVAVWFWRRRRVR
jgi:uncharacterized protein (TIGR03382 family)